MDTLIALAAPISAIIVAIIEWRAYNDRKAMATAKAEEELRQKQREKESRLSMKMMNATMQLSIVSANALTNGHNNGNVEDARKAAAEAQAEYNTFLQEVAAHSIASRSVGGSV